MLLGDAECYYAATAKLLFSLPVIITVCVGDGDNPPTRLTSSWNPCRIQKRPLNNIKCTFWQPVSVTVFFQKAHIILPKIDVFGNISA